eukprot:m.56388 g.56388  ORF g.56388 m.56388 type:complete len:449 (+) comp12033_c0_seq1:1417-2763(+)
MLTRSLLRAAVSLILVAHTLAFQPPRGWNSYDSFDWTIDEKAFMDNCMYMAQHMPTYEYCVIDYLWYRDNNTGAFVLDEFGRPQPDPIRWPSASGGRGFTDVAARVHVLGLKFGIHVMRGISRAAIAKNTRVLGTNTTARDIALPQQACPWDNDFVSVDVTQSAGQAFYASLYDQFAEWGVDFVKNDCVFGDYVPAEIETQSREIAAIFERTGHRIVYSLSPGEHDGKTDMEVTHARTISTLVNMYRVTDDDWDKWSDISLHFDVAAEFAAANLIGAPGLLGQPSFPDLDMLPLGWLTSPGSSRGPYRNTSLTPDEQRTQMTLWGIARSPLMFGGDMRHMDAFTLSLLTNPGVLAVNTNSTGNREVLRQGDWRVWSAYGTDDVTAYLAAFNTGAGTQTITLAVSMVHMGSSCRVRDLWAQRDMGVVSSISVSAPTHGARFYLLSQCSS